MLTEILVLRAPYINLPMVASNVIQCILKRGQTWAPDPEMFVALRIAPSPLPSQVHLSTSYWPIGLAPQLYLGHWIIYNGNNQLSRAGRLVVGVISNQVTCI